MNYCTLHFQRGSCYTHCCPLLCLLTLSHVYTHKHIQISSQTLSIVMLHHTCLYPSLLGLTLVKLENKSKLSLKSFHIHTRVYFSHLMMLMLIPQASSTSMSLCAIHVPSFSPSSLRHPHSQRTQ